MANGNKDLVKTTLGGVPAHDHIVYQDFDNKVFICLEDDDGRAHKLTWVDGEQVPTDPATGQPMLEPQEDGSLIDPQTGQIFIQSERGKFQIIDSETGQPRDLKRSGIFIEPDPVDGHTHEGFVPYERKLNRKKEKPQDVVNEFYALYKYATEKDGPSIRRGEEAMEFYKGVQWDNKLKSYLEENDRAALTFNRVQPEIDALSGVQRENRQDITITPVEEGDALAAEVYTKLLKQIYEACDYHKSESKVFLDIIRTGIGWFDIYLDVTDTLEGDVKIRRRKFNSVKTLEHEEEDLSDCSAIFKDSFYSKEELAQLYPKKAAEIKKDFNEYAAGMYKKPHLTITDKNGGDQYAKSDNVYPCVPEADTFGKNVDLVKKEYRVVECWKRVFTTGEVLSIPDFDFVYNLKGWDSSDIKKLKRLPSSYIIKKNVKRMRIVKWAGNVLLSDENVADLPEDDFFCVPAYCYYEDNEFWGKIELVKDAQRELNQRLSQSIDIGNKAIAYGYFIDGETFETPQDEKDFINNNTKPGGVWKTADIGRPPLKIDGGKFPSEIVQLMEMAEGRIQKQLNTQAEVTGANQSGEHLMATQRQKMTVNEGVFQNFTEARMKVAWLTLLLIHRYYTPDRIIRMISGSEELAEYSEAELLDAITNSKPEHYNLVATETEYSPTVRLAVQAVLTKLAASGYAIPPQSIIKTLDIPRKEKDELLQQIEQSQAAESESAQTQSNTELEKTLIAQGIVPPAVSERMQLSQAQDIEGLRSTLAMTPGQEMEFPGLQQPVTPAANAGQKEFNVIPGPNGEQRIEVNQGNRKRVFDVTEFPDGKRRVKVIEDGAA